MEKCRWSFQRQIGILSSHPNLIFFQLKSNKTSKNMFQYTISCIFRLKIWEKCSKIVQNPAASRTSCFSPQPTAFVQTLAANVCQDDISIILLWVQSGKALWGKIFQCYVAALPFILPRQKKMKLCNVSWHTWCENRSHYHGQFNFDAGLLFMEGLLSIILKIKIKFIGSPKMFDLLTLSSAVLCIVCTTG